MGSSFWRGEKLDDDGRAGAAGCWFVFGRGGRREEDALDSDGGGGGGEREDEDVGVVGRVRGVLSRHTADTFFLLLLS